MLKQNNKGYITTLTIISVMLLSLVFLALFYSVVRTRNVQVWVSENLTAQMVSERTIYDRIYGVFNHDFYRTHDITFEDLDVTYKINNVSFHGDIRTLELINLDETADKSNVPSIISIEISLLPNPSWQPNSKKIHFKILP